MNIEQIARLAAYQAQEVKQSGVLGPAMTASIIRTFVNDANREAEKLIRRVREDYFTRVMNSATDTTAEKICGISYTPSVSLKLAASTMRFTLPPDFLTLKSIRVVTAGYENVDFQRRDITHPDFQTLLRRDTLTTALFEMGCFYDIIGERTLMISPLLPAALDIELIYIATTKRLHYYSVGTITATDASTAITGSGTTWLAGSPFDSAYLDLMVSGTGVATVPVADPGSVYDGVALSRVASITTDTAIVLAAPKVGAVAAGGGYALASVPAIPEDAHYALADYATASVLASVGTPGKAEWFMKRFQSRVAGITMNAATRDVDVQTVVDYNPAEQG